ncbi:MAG: hypothetical protein ABUL41_02395 [Chitinophagaceae bacterium]
MIYYYPVFLTMLLSLILLLVRSFILNKKNTQTQLFTEALRNENSGHFEEAIITYETALNEAKKIRFSNSSLKNRIIEKLKVLHTIIEYKNNLHFTR